MKRIISAILAVFMLFGAFSALAAPGDVTIYDEQLTGGDYYVSSFAWYNDVMYMTDWGENIYTWTQESGEIKTWPMPKELTEMDPEEGFISFSRIIPGDDGVYFLYEVYEVEDENSFFNHMLLYKPTVNGEELVFDTEPYELEWDDLVEEYDDYAYANTLNNAFVRDGMLVGSSWSDSGENVVAVIEIEDDDMELYVVENMNAIYPYKDGKALTVVRGYESEDDPCIVITVDLESGETEEIMQIATSGWTYPSHLAYDASGDYLYYVLNGELNRVKGMDFATVEAVTALNVDEWSNNLASVTADGAFYICGDYSSIKMRNTDPSLRAAQSITVYSSYNSAMEKALADFTANNADCEVVMANSYESLTQAMMNQSSSVDIYTVYVDNQDFAAVFNRGYMAELDSSEVITDFVNSVYPALRDSLVYDGHVVAIPVEMWTNCYSYNPVAFEKLGLTEADVPTSWDELLDLAIRLPEIMGENEEGISFMDPYYTAADARSMLFYEIIDDYMMYLQGDDVEFAFDTPLLRGLLEKLDQIDYLALGFLESYEMEMDINYIYMPENILFSTYADISSRVWSMNDDYSKPMPLAMEKDGKQTITGNMTVAFVNPYSENRELAIKYLESAVRSLDHTIRVDMCPDFNEPLENAYYEENIASYEETIASWKEQLEASEDEEERAMIEQNIAEYEEYMEEYIAENRYDISEESIAYYRNYAQYIAPVEFIGFDEEASTEYYTQLYQYMDGTIDADTFLKNIDNKLRMMILEQQ